MTRTASLSVTVFTLKVYIVNYNLCVACSNLTVNSNINRTIVTPRGRRLKQAWRVKKKSENIQITSPSINCCYGDRLNRIIKKALIIAQ